MRKGRRKRVINSPCILWLVVMNLVVFWFMFYLTHSESDSAHLMLQGEMHTLATLKESNSKGKRNTYCDHLRHLVDYHDISVDVLEECLGLPPTDLQDIIINEGI